MNKGTWIRLTWAEVLGLILKHCGAESESYPNSQAQVTILRSINSGQVDPDTRFHFVEVRMTDEPEPKPVQPPTGPQVVFANSLTPPQQQKPEQYNLTVPVPPPVVSNCSANPGLPAYQCVPPKQQAPVAYPSPGPYQQTPPSTDVHD